MKYGYIVQIYEILERDNGMIVPEDTYSSVIFCVKFGCRLCHPLENTQIICRVNQTTDVLISLVRDPMHLLVTTDDDRINRDVFYRDTFDKTIKIKKTDEILSKGMYVKVTILTKSFVDKDSKILAICKLDDIASDEEIQKFNSDDTSSAMVEFADYIGQDSLSKPPSHKQKKMQV
jgi:DNA-directed RNA polymerase subunit E'/Rpb7